MSSLVDTGKDTGMSTAAPNTKGIGSTSNWKKLRNSISTGSMQFVRRSASSDNVNADRKSSFMSTGSAQTDGISLSTVSKEQQRVMRFWKNLKYSLKEKYLQIIPHGEVKDFMEEHMKTKKVLTEMGLFHPLKTWKIRWDFFFCFIVLLSSSYIPYKMAFSYEVDSNFDVAFESVCTIIFCTDIAFHFNTARYDQNKGILVIDRRKIAIHYLKFWFTIDLLSSFPFDLIIKSAFSSDSSSVVYLALFRLIRLLKLFKLARLRRFVANTKYNGICIIFLQLTFVAHLITCFWYYFGLYYPYTSDDAAGFPYSWVAAYTPGGFDGTDQYAISMYWTLYTMLGIGYGDVHPVNTGCVSYIPLTILDYLSACPPDCLTVYIGSVSSPSSWASSARYSSGSSSRR